AGAPLVVMGRYRGVAHGTIALEARDAAGRAWKQLVPGSVTVNPAISCLWARGQLRELEDRYVIDRGQTPELEKEIVDVSLRFGVLCRFTAFVAVDKSETVNQGGQGAKILQPVEAPGGWDMLNKISLAATTSAMYCMAMPQSAAASAEPVETESVDSYLMEFPEEASAGQASAGGPASPPPTSFRGMARRLRTPGQASLG